jgi:tRNA dimethylallyltransferase
MINADSSTLLVIAGPTAVGKTALCVELAKRLGTEIVSADARQFYRELRIGTAKPTPEEMQGVPHHFIDSHSITETYTAGQYERDALRVLDELFQKYPVVILTGGSGLYLKVVTDGMDALPDPDPALRAALRQRLETEGLSTLLAELERADPAYFAQVDRQNSVRVLRALEVIGQTGQPYSSFRTGTQAERPFRTLQLCLTRPREELYARIDARMDAMLAAGLVDEVRNLVPFREHNALQTVGYQEVFGYLDGTYDYAELVRLLKRNSRRYAKRQLTWFRNQGGYREWAAEDGEELWKRIEEEVSSRSGVDNLQRMIQNEVE